MESAPVTLAQAQQLNRSLTEKVLDRAESDPQWKQRLIEDSEAAMREAGFPEIQQLQQMQQAALGASPEGEVTGQEFIGGYPCTPGYYCVWYTYLYQYQYATSALAGP